MKRTAIGAVAGLAIWFGSALAAEAQTIIPTGPQYIQAGTTSWNFTGAIFLPTPMNYKISTSIYRNGVYQTCISTSFPNPGVQNSNFSQPISVTFSVNAGDVVTFKAQLLWNRTTTYAQDWSVTVSPTRPPTSVTRQTPLPVKRAAPMAMAAASEWRRE